MIESPKLGIDAETSPPPTDEESAALARLDASLPDLTCQARETLAGAPCGSTPVVAVLVVACGHSVDFCAPCAADAEAYIERFAEEHGGVRFVCLTCGRLVEAKWARL